MSEVLSLVDPVMGVHKQIGVNLFKALKPLLLPELKRYQTVPQSVA